MQQGSQEAHSEGAALRMRSNRLKDGAAWFQAGVGVLAVALLLASRWLWICALLCGASGAIITALTLAGVGVL